MWTVRPERRKQMPLTSETVKREEFITNQARLALTMVASQVPEVERILLDEASKNTKEIMLRLVESTLRDAWLYGVEETCKIYEGDNYKAYVPAVYGGMKETVDKVCPA